VLSQPVAPEKSVVPGRSTSDAGRLLAAAGTYR